MCRYHEARQLLYSAPIFKLKAGLLHTLNETLLPNQWVGVKSLELYYLLKWGERPHESQEGKAAYDETWRLLNSMPGLGSLSVGFEVGASGRDILPQAGRDAWFVPMQDFVTAKKELKHLRISFRGGVAFELGLEDKDEVERLTKGSCMTITVLKTPRVGCVIKMPEFGIPPVAR